MKYSLPFYAGNPYLNKADEISIRYTAADEAALSEFLDQHTHQRVVLRIPQSSGLTDKNYYYLQELFKLYAAGSVICCFDTLTLSSAQAALPHFFAYDCKDIEEIVALAAQGVTDIYVGSNLGYQLDIIRKMVQCNIRFRPNLIQNAFAFSDIETQFFIRPEDIQLYEPYIDYIEFYYINIKDTATAYKAYCINHRYDGWLSNIIFNAPAKIHNSCVTSVMAAERLKCHKSCVYAQSTCKICAHCYELAQTLYAKLHTIRLNEKKDTES